MEALGFGANVAAFVVIASQLSKVLYITFSSIKDGPNNVRRISSHLLQLHGVLEQLRHSPLAIHDTALAGHVGLCVSDLNSVADVVQKLQLTPGEKRAGIMWKRFRHFLDETKLDRIYEQVAAHISTLSFRLSILHSNTTHELLSDIRTVRQSVDDLSVKVGKQSDGLASGFGAVRNTFNSQYAKLHNGLTSIQTAVDGISSMSQQRADNMFQLLADIKDRITHRTQNGSHQGTGENSFSKQTMDCELSMVDTYDQPGSDASLIRSITRLCALINEKNRSFNTFAKDDSRAEDIIEDLQTLLGSAQKYENATQLIDKISPGKTQNSLDNKALRGTLRRFGQYFGQFNLIINDQTRAQKEPLTTLSRRKRTVTGTVLGELGTLSLTVTKQAQAFSVEKEIQTDVDYTDYAMALSFVPNDLRQFSMIVASVTRRQKLRGLVAPISRLAVNRVLPAKSRVFTVVLEGRLDELQAMLQEGQATLRDHDEYGANLLFYAVKGIHVHICKFSLENGADPDHIAGVRGVIRPSRRPWRFLQPRSIFEFYRGMPHDWVSLKPCFKLLLEAGADPTPTSETYHFLADVTRWGLPESIKLVWGSGLVSPFAGINDPLSGGAPPLLIACLAISQYLCNVERIRTLLDAGADIDVRDTSGRSCLHTCLLNLACTRDIAAQHETLSFLVARGANVYARDNLGQSVCDIAYADGFPKRQFGTFAGDLWDAVLQSSGYNIAEFRKGNPRKAVYNSGYTRLDFETIWQGREDRCPYWNDEPWPSNTQSPPSVRCSGACDESEQTIDMPECGKFEDPVEPEIVDNMGEDGRAREKSQSQQDQLGFEAPEAPNPYLTCYATRDSSEPDHPLAIEEAVKDKGKSTCSQWCGSAANLEFPDLFENPWADT